MEAVANITPEGRRILSDIAGLMDRFGVVSGKIGADRNEVLGIHYGNQPTTDTGRGSRPELLVDKNEAGRSAACHHAGRHPDAAQGQPGGNLRTNQ